MQYSLGPMLYCWDKLAVHSFYDNVAQSAIPLVYLGETVCNRRRELTNKDYLAIAHMLKDAGKQVVLSSMTLVENSSELTEMSKFINNGEFMIEANDMAAIQIAKEHHLPFISGPDINHYNLASLKKLHNLGMQRFVMPVELSKHWLKQVIGADKSQLGFEVEVIGYGYLPLAHSARCFTARHLGLPKDKCDTACKNYPKGILVQTQDSQSLLRLNGIQTQSAQAVDLRQDIDEMRNIGVDYFRLLPNSLITIDMAEQLINAEAKKYSTQSLLSTELSSEPLPLESTLTSCNGYWHGKAGIANI